MLAVPIYIYTMQGLVKEVTLKSHGNNAPAVLYAFSLGGILNYNFFINPFSLMRIGPTIHYNAGDNYTRTL